MFYHLLVVFHVYHFLTIFLPWLVIVYHVLCFKTIFKQNEMSTIRPFPELSHSKRARKALTLGLSWFSVGPAQLHSFNRENRTFAVADLQSAKLSSQCIGPYLAPKNTMLRLMNSCDSS